MEQKFRAWDGDRMVYFSDFALGIEKGRKIKPYVYFKTDTFYGEVKLSSHQIMQSSELLDKFDKEIFEDDIVQCEYGIGKVIFKNGCFMVEWIDDKESEMELLFSRKGRWKREGDEQFTVIGNIYQNKDLLILKTEDEKN
jgi:uncharacterized phage protein (TIGR01671 family)